MADDRGPSECISSLKTYIYVSGDVSTANGCLRAQLLQESIYFAPKSIQVILIFTYKTVKMSGAKTRTREATGKKGTEQQTKVVGRDTSSSPHGEASSNQATAANTSQANVLEEICDFCQHMINN